MGVQIPVQRVNFEGRVAGHCKLYERDELISLCGLLCCVSLCICWCINPHPYKVGSVQTPHIHMVIFVCILTFFR